MRSLRACLLLVCVPVAASACLSPVQGFCQASGECTEDDAKLTQGGQDAVGVSDDSIRVCVVENDGLLRQFRANEEPECQELATKWETYMACVSAEYQQGDACGGLLRGDANNCLDELQDFQSARGDVGALTCSEAEQ